MRRCGWVPLLVLTGCSQLFGLDSPIRRDDSGLSDDAMSDGATVDARPDTPPGAACVGTGLYVACWQPANLPTITSTVSVDGTIDTSSSTFCTRVVPQSGGPELCVIEYKQVTLSGNLRVTGSRPYVVVAVESIEIKATGALDASSGGAGVYLQACGQNGVPGGGGLGGSDLSLSASAGAGGGGGGGFGTPGGKGANGSGGNAGSAGIVTQLTSIHGGCRGGRGGASDGGNGGVGGLAGGAIYLVATTISIAGTINASGKGGGGGPNKAGGGGGGSGGLIGLDAASIAIGPSAVVFANGGGGGEGGGGGVAGNAGNDPASPQAAAGGGTGNANGGDGGAGSVSSGGGQDGFTGSNGGGGGGGGAGYVKIFGTPTIAGSVSPPPS